MSIPTLIEPRRFAWEVRVAHGVHESPASRSGGLDREEQQQQQEHRSYSTRREDSNHRLPRGRLIYVDDVL